MFRQLPFDKTVPYRRNMRQISAAKLRGIRVTKRDSIESQQNIPSQCVSRPVFQFQLSDAASSPEFFLYFLLFSLSLSLSLSLITLGRRVRSLKFKYRESFAKNNVVPVVSWAKFHGGNSWYSFVTWPPPFHRIRL